MSKLPVYGWWDQVPDHHKTMTQLAKLGKKPGGPVRAQIHYGRGRREREYDLYDVNEAKDKQQATPAQLAALEKAHLAKRTCKECQEVKEKPSDLNEWGVCWSCSVREEEEGHREEHDKSIEWARRLLQKGTALILDTETTSLDGYICELAIIDLDGNVLFDSLINPQAPNEATYIHGITNAMTATAPTFADVEPELRRLLHGRTVVVYNAPFDQGMVWSEIVRMCSLPERLLETLRDYHTKMEYFELRSEYFNAARDQANWWTKRSKWRCAMRKYSAFVGDWDDYYENYRYQALGGGHRALGDCLACLDLIKRMAASPLATEETLMPVDELADGVSHNP